MDTSCSAEYFSLLQTMIFAREIHLKIIELLSDMLLVCMISTNKISETVKQMHEEKNRANTRDISILFITFKVAQVGPRSR